MTAQSSDEQPVPEVAAAGTEDAGRSEADRIWGIMRRKTQELVATGMREGHARGLAQLEMRIAQWPSGWGDDLLVLIYGDFNPPPAAAGLPRPWHHY